MSNIDKKDCFENPCAELWLYFIHSPASLFHSAVKRIEGQSVTYVEVAQVLEDLQSKCQERANQKFIPLC